MHTYAPAIVSQSNTASFDTARKVLTMMRLGRRPKFTGISSNVMHFLVESWSRYGQVHRVEFDASNKSFRCSCEAQFYGNHCSHIELVKQSIRLT